MRDMSCSQRSGRGIVKTTPTPAADRRLPKCGMTVSTRRVCSALVGKCRRPCDACSGAEGLDCAKRADAQSPFRDEAPKAAESMSRNDRREAKDCQYGTATAVVAKKQELQGPARLVMRA